MWKLSRSEWHLMLWITIFSIFFSAFSLTLLAVFFFSGVWKVTAAEGGGEKSHPITFFLPFRPNKTGNCYFISPTLEEKFFIVPPPPPPRVKSLKFWVIFIRQPLHHPSCCKLEEYFCHSWKSSPQLTSFFIPLNPTTRQNPIPKLKHFDDTGTHQIYTRRSFDWNKFFYSFEWNPEKCECEMCVLCEGGSSKRKIVS